MPLTNAIIVVKRSCHYYPDSRAARVIAAIAGTKTLTEDTLLLCRGLGLPLIMKDSDGTHKDIDHESIERYDQSD
jgi:hypothetical protein